MDAPNNIWDVAINLMKEQDNDEEKATIESSIVFLGNKQGGKTTLINRYLSKTDAPKPTLGLEYVFARHGGKGLDLAKDVCHLWELGGGTSFVNLLDVVLTPSKISKTCLVFVVDLSMPQEIWSTVETLLSYLKSKIDQILSLSESKGQNMHENLLQATKDRIGEDQMSKDASLIPVVFFGSKYDTFQNFDPEKKKILCKGLRFLALTNGASLYFISSKSESLLTRMKGIISNLAFDLQSSKTYTIDHNKPLCIPFGSDSAHKIGLSSADDGNDFLKSYDMWKNTFMSTFPPENNKSEMSEDPGKDPNFAERDVDMMRSHKDKELEDYKRKSQKRTEWSGMVESN